VCVYAYVSLNTYVYHTCLQMYEYMFSRDMCVHIMLI